MPTYGMRKIASSHAIAAVGLRRFGMMIRAAIMIDDVARARAMIQARLMPRMSICASRYRLASSAAPHPSRTKTSHPMRSDRLELRPEPRRLRRERDDRMSHQTTRLVRRRTRSPALVGRHAVDRARADAGSRIRRDRRVRGIRQRAGGVRGDAAVRVRRPGRLHRLALRAGRCLGSSPRSGRVRRIRLRLGNHLGPGVGDRCGRGVARCLLRSHRARGRSPAVRASRVPRGLPGRTGSVRSIHRRDRAEEVEALDHLGAGSASCCSAS